MTNKIERAASKLLSRRAPGTKAPRLDSEIRPTSLTEALAIQEKVIELNEYQVSGWKCLQPLAVDKYIVGPIFDNEVMSGEQCVLFADNDKARIEPEIAFILSADLPARNTNYTDAEIDAVIGSCHMALELIQSRYADDSGAEFYDNLADCLFNQGLFIGPEIDKEKAYTASEFEVSIVQGATNQTFAGKHPNIIPPKPIYWLVNYITKKGVTLKAGEALITGSYCGVVDLDFDVPTAIRYEGIGQFDVIFSKR